MCELWPETDEIVMSVNDDETINMYEETYTVTYLTKIKKHIYSIEK